MALKGFWMRCNQMVNTLCYGGVLEVIEQGARGALYFATTFGQGCVGLKPRSPRSEAMDLG